MILTSIIGIIGSIVAVIFLSGLVIHDSRAVRRDRAYVRHPHARKWRVRPVVSVCRSMVSDTFLRTLRQNYRKLTVVDESEQSSSEFTLVLTREMTLHKQAIPEALRYFSDDTSVNAIELIPSITAPHTTGSLLANYRLILASMLMKSRLGLGIPPTRSLFPVLMRRKTIPKNKLRDMWHHIYAWGNYAIAASLPLMLTYGLYLAFVPRQTSLLSIIVCGFGIFLMTAIWSYDRLSFLHRMIYTMLIPASLGYFLVLAWLRPLKMLTDVIKAKLPIGIGLFARVKDILRIV